METYIFYGVIVPERAQLSLRFSLEFSHLGSGILGTIRVSIILNQLVVWVDTDHQWDIMDLRNVVKTVLQNHLAILGYLKGYAYDLQITRVLNSNLQVDYVFGVDIPCIEKRGKSIDLSRSLMELGQKTTGENGIFVSRCLNDLVFSMKHADDTGFYCYRAIESLRHHCAHTNGISNSDKGKQWEKFREISGCSESMIKLVMKAADPLRHGDVLNITSDQRAELFKLTWDIVDAYLKKIN